MNLEDFVKVLPSIAKENQETFDNGDGEYLISDRISYPVDLEYPQIGFEPNGKRLVFELAFGRIPVERFPRTIIENILKLIKEDRKYRDIKLEVSFDPETFQDEKDILKHFNSVHVLGHTTRPNSTVPDLLSADFGLSTTEPVYEMRLSCGDNIYEKFRKRIIKELGLSISADKYIPGFVKQYRKGPESAQEDLGRFVSEMKKLELPGFLQGIDISANYKTNSLELDRLSFSPRSRVYRVEVEDHPMPSRKIMDVIKGAFSIGVNYTVPSNSLTVNLGMPSDNDGDFNFWLDANSPSLISLQEYVCGNMGVGFK